MARTLSAHERTELLTRGKGAELREFLNRFITDPDRVPRRSDMLDMLDELLPDRTGLDLEPVRQALATKAGQVAKAAADRGGRFELRGRVDEFVVETTQKLEELDRVVALPEPEEPIDAGAVADQADLAHIVGGRATADTLRELGHRFDEAERIRHGGRVA